MGIKVQRTNQESIGLLSLTADCFLYAIIYLCYLKLVSDLKGFHVSVFALPARLDLIFNFLFAAAVPYAIAVLVRKYAQKEDIRSVLNVRRLAILMQGLFGILLFLTGLLLSGMLTNRMSFPAQDSTVLRIGIILSVLSGAVSCVLSSYRGFYLYLKSAKFNLRMALFRRAVHMAVIVFSILLIHLKQEWMPYLNPLFFFSEFSGSTVVLIMYYRYDKSHIGPLVREARHKGTAIVRKRTVARDFLRLILLSAIVLIGYNMITLYDMTHFMGILSKMQMETNKAEYLYGLIHCYRDFFVVSGVCIIAGVLEYNGLLEESAYDRTQPSEVRANITKGLSVIALIALPAAVFQYSLSRPIAYSAFGATNIDYSESVIAWSCLSVFLETLALYTIYICLKLKHKMELFVSMIIALILKAAGMYLLIQRLGFIGGLFSTCISSGAFSYLSIAWCLRSMHISGGEIVKRIGKTAAAAIAANGIIAVLKIINPAVSYGESDMLFWLTVGYLICGTAVYLVLTNVLVIPQAVFGKGWLRLLIPERKEKTNESSR